MGRRFFYQNQFNLKMFKHTSLYKIAKKISQIDEGRLFKIILDKKQVKDLIIDQNTNVQLRQQHVDSLGQKLWNNWTNRDYYGKGDELGRDGQPYEVFNSGDYYDSFAIYVNEAMIVISSNPMKGNDSLFDMYTEKIEGLTPQGLERLQVLAKELYINYFRRVYVPK